MQELAAKVINQKAAKKVATIGDEAEYYSYTPPAAAPQRCEGDCVPSRL